MTSPQYKEKELRIMRALMDLLAGGMHIRDIKTSDIADAAGLGKGTLYNYFSSKEDIIAKTITFSIEVTLQEVTGRMRDVAGFHEKCYAILSSVHGIVSNENSDFHLMLFNVGGKEMKQYFGNDVTFIKECLAFIFDSTLELARLGAKEGVILPIEDEEYTYSVFAAALMSFVHARCRMESPTQEELSRAMDNAWKMLVKAAN